MNVNKDIFEGKWEQIRAQTKVWWSLFTEEDLKKVEKAPIKLDKYAMMLRMNMVTPTNAPGRKSTNELQN